MMINNSPFPNPFPTSPYGNVPKVSPKKEKENRYLNFAADAGGCFFYRIGFAQNHINMTNRGESTSLTKMIFDKNWYRDIKTVKLQRQASPQQLEFVKFLKSIQEECGFKMIYEVDDVIFREEIPDYNAYKHSFDSDEVRKACVEMINLVDEVTVTCKFMRDLYIEKTGKKEISVVPNFMPYWWIGHHYNKSKAYQNFEKNKKRPRIVYSGSGAHFDMKNLNNQKDDFSHVLDFIISNRLKYQFIFIGAYPPQLHQYIKSNEIEFHPWKSLLEYPTFLSSLNAQLFLAPLEDNNFNKSKSDIKFIEAAQLGVPCLCQDLCTYDSAPDSLKFKDVSELEHKVEMLLNWKNRSKYYSLVPELRNIGENRFLELPENIGAFMEPLDTAYGSRERKFMNKWG